VLERLQVRAGQLPVIVNTAIVPCPCGRDAAGILAGLIDPVEAAGTTLVVLPLPPVELVDPVSPEELPVPEAPVPGLLGAEVPVAEVPLLGVEVPVGGVVDPVPVTLVGAVPTGVADDVPSAEPGAPASVGVLPARPSVLVVEAGVDVTGADVGSVGSSTLEVPVGYSVLS
jgi:hypothetical protein